MFEEYEMIYLCSHCNRVDHQTRSWPQVCKLHAIETTPYNVIAKKSKVGYRAVFYDPNIDIVDKERKSRGL
jgi:hypothetical protein